MVTIQAGDEGLTAVTSLPHATLGDSPSAKRPYFLQGSGPLTELCGQHCEVVPYSSLAVQGHGCADGAVLRLDGEAALHVRVGEDGVSGETEPRSWGGLGAGPQLAVLPPSLLFLLLGLLAHLSGWAPAPGAEPAPCTKSYNSHRVPLEVVNIKYLS